MELLLTYGCETWTLLADTERRIQAFESKCPRKLLSISYKDHVTNESVRDVRTGQDTVETEVHVHCDFYSAIPVTKIEAHSKAGRLSITYIENLDIQEMTSKYLERENSRRVVLTSSMAASIGTGDAGM
ncbi:retrovirus-related Pol polyprotein LINE-1 [Elysia marginata]|uniref:Retrovirus-related Pol polyprotein LINE-1 n=1 Tax=Elysia marginata TaxID=1093978 RepID=A0AAV4HPT6_9GAST|nr:retrovirus-related Pol polyprotein LINE-1 [Elysia marginata]